MSEVEAFEYNEEVWGIVQCYNKECRFRGRMEGIIQHDNKREIIFFCPKCNTVERIKNPEVNT